MNESALKVIAELYPKHGVHLWRNAQWSDAPGCWHDCQGPADLNLNDDDEYRVKPNTHIVNGIECPSPWSEFPNIGETFYRIDSTQPDGILKCIMSENSSRSIVKNVMRFGIWKTYEDAKANRDAYFPHVFKTEE